MVSFKILLWPACMILGHDVAAKDVTTSSDGYRHWTPYCSRCGVNWEARDERPDDVLVLNRKSEKS
jgi:hypothetical protein